MPSPYVQVGDRLTGGDIYADVQENSLLSHRIMAPPNARGTIKYIAPAGEYGLEDKVLELEFGGVKKVDTALRPCFCCSLTSFKAKVPVRRAIEVRWLRVSYSQEMVKVMRGFLSFLKGMHRLQQHMPCFAPHMSSRILS